MRRLVGWEHRARTRFDMGATRRRLPAVSDFALHRRRYRVGIPDGGDLELRLRHLQQAMAAEAEEAKDSRPEDGLP